VAPVAQVQQPPSPDSKQKSRLISGSFFWIAPS
jgi:hypothetical protein